MSTAGAGNPAGLVVLQLARLLQICGDHPQVLVFAAETVSGQHRQAEDGVGQLVDRSRLLRCLKPLFRDQVSYVALPVPWRNTGPSHLPGRGNHRPAAAASWLMRSCTAGEMSSISTVLT